MSLLAKVKAVPARGKVLPTVDSEDLDVVLAYLHGEVTAAQIGASLEKSQGWVIGWATRVLRSAIALGDVTITKVPAPAIKAVAR